MKRTIEITETLYQRLARHVVEFESPAQVLEKVLDYYENNSEAGGKKTSNSSKFRSLEIVYYPSSEEKFKQELLRTKQAFVQIIYVDGRTEERVWNAGRFTSSSNLKNNLHSGYLRDWKERGVYKLQVAIEKNDLE